MFGKRNVLWELKAKHKEVYGRHMIWHELVDPLIVLLVVGRK